LNRKIPAQSDRKLKYRTPVSGVFRRKDFGFVTCDNNRASVSRFVAGIGQSLTVQAK
jgi:hypothetical protein